MPTLLLLGATSDIGLAIARRFAEARYDIQLAARQVEALEPTRADLSIRYGVNCTAHRFEAGDFAGHAAFFDSLPAQPDVTVYVIGYMTDNLKAAEQWSESKLTIEANYTGAVSLLNHVAASYAAQNRGAIVGVSSVAGLRGRQSNYIYGSAKAGFTAYLAGLRNYLYHRQVHVLTVLPGFVYTKMTEHLKLPKPLTAQPADVANVIYHGVLKKSNVVYVKWFWRWIMLIITSIPEALFKKLKL